MFVLACEQGLCSFASAGQKASDGLGELDVSLSETCFRKLAKSPKSRQNRSWRPAPQRTQQVAASAAAR